MASIPSSPRSENLDALPFQTNQEAQERTQDFDTANRVMDQSIDPEQRIESQKRKNEPKTALTLI